MPGAPRAASASPSEPAPSGRLAWDKRQRLLRAAEFANFSPPHAPWRAARRWLSMSALILPAAVPPVPGHAPVAVRAPVRFGFTISKRQARRAVVRNTVKRLLREAARQASPRLATCAAGREVDVLLRLKAPLPGAQAATWADVKLQLRREADALCADLQRWLERRGTP